MSSSQNVYVAGEQVLHLTKHLHADLPDQSPASVSMLRCMGQTPLHSSAACANAA